MCVFDVGKQIGYLHYLRKVEWFLKSDRITYVFNNKIV